MTSQRKAIIAAAAGCALIAAFFVVRALVGGSDTHPDEYNGNYDYAVRVECHLEDDARVEYVSYDEGDQWTSDMYFAVHNSPVSGAKVHINNTNDHVISVICD